MGWLHVDWSSVDIHIPDTFSAGIPGVKLSCTNTAKVMLAFLWYKNLQSINKLIPVYMSPVHNIPPPPHPPAQPHIHTQTHKHTYILYLLSKC